MFYEQTTLWFYGHRSSFWEAIFVYHIYDQYQVGRNYDAPLPNQVAFDWPDFIAGVFNLKARHFLNDLKKKNIFGRYKGLVRTISTKNEACFTYTSYSFLDPEDNFTDAEKID